MKKDLIRSKREQKGYTQEELAELAGCARQTINLIEAGNYSNPTFKALFKYL
ncbi:helix-turn-helix transcriptional regulator [endosymbiont 'TC1' of Trimyema compressum]|uniref:helix-turn-helix transcriptional regulator n=1 Tax=endosymbiont 'TC1' of Trimyema compressum TaxID=243899 RepID=UPI001FDFACBF|nr:helix-turn-helix domain-containing protein [endosymbiont 'TC1' of Trimyema compressum]